MRSIRLLSVIALAVLAVGAFAENVTTPTVVVRRDAVEPRPNEARGDVSYQHWFCCGEFGGYYDYREIAEDCTTPGPAVITSVTMDFFTPTEPLGTTGTLRWYKYDVTGPGDLLYTRTFDLTSDYNEHEITLSSSVSLPRRYWISVQLDREEKTDYLYAMRCVAGSYVYGTATGTTEHVSNNGVQIKVDDVWYQMSGSGTYFDFHLLSTGETTEEQPPCPGDANDDRTVNSADLSVLLAQWSSTVWPTAGADFNGDGTVNGSDLSVLLNNVGDCD